MPRQTTSTQHCWSGAPGPGRPNTQTTSATFVRVVNGSAGLEIDGEESELSAGEAVIVPKGERRRITAGRSGVRYISVHLGDLRCRSAPRSADNKPLAPLLAPLEQPAFRAREGVPIQPAHGSSGLNGPAWTRTRLVAALSGDSAGIARSERGGSASSRRRRGATSAARIETASRSCRSAGKRPVRCQPRRSWKSSCCPRRKGRTCSRSGAELARRQASPDRAGLAVRRGEGGLRRRWRSRSGASGSPGAGGGRPRGGGSAPGGAPRVATCSPRRRRRP